MGHEAAGWKLVQENLAWQLQRFQKIGGGGNTNCRQQMASISSELGLKLWKQGRVISKADEKGAYHSCGHHPILDGYSQSRNRVLHSNLQGLLGRRRVSLPVVSSSPQKARCRCF